MSIIKFLHVVFAVCVLSLSTRTAEAESQEPANRTHVDTDDRERAVGRAGAQLLAAAGADVATTALTGLAILLSCPICHGRSEHLVDGLIIAGSAVRPVALGLSTSLASRPDGAGSSFASMAGAVPGSLLIIGAWQSEVPSIRISGIVAGHALSIIGAVAGYRWSAKRQFERRGWSAMPTAYAREGEAGLALSGRF